MERPMKEREPPRIGTDEDYQAIEKAAGIETPNNAFRRELSVHIEHCIRHLKSGYIDVRNADILKAVRRIRTDVDDAKLRPLLKIRIAPRANLGTYVHTYLTRISHATLDELARGYTHETFA